MSRSKMEQKLILHAFEEFTKRFQDCISRLVNTKKCESTSDEVIDKLCQECRHEIFGILYDRDAEWAKMLRNGDALTPEARECIRAYIDQSLSHAAKIADLEDDEFEAAYRSIFDQIAEAKRQRRALSAAEKDRWSFFNMPEANADFEVWRERLLSPAQAVALSFGKDPNVVTPEKMKPYNPVGGSIFRPAYKDRLDLIEAAVAAGDLQTPMAMSAFVKWAANCGIRLPQALTEQTGKPKEDADFWREKFEIAQKNLNELRRGVDDLPPKSKASIYRLILGMAIARFEYRTDQRSNSTKAIREELASLKLDLKDDAIRDHLSDAAEHLEFEYRTPRRWRGVRIGES